MKAGWSHFLKNEPMLLIHTRTVNFINRVRVSLHALANLNSSAKGHFENSSSRLAIDEQAIHDMDQCLTEFASDPFDLRKHHPSTLAIRPSCIRRTRKGL